MTARMAPRPDATSAPPAPPSDPLLSQSPEAVYMPQPQIQVTEAGWSHSIPAVHDDNLLTMPMPQFDLDRTPRAAFFPPNAQDPLYAALPTYPLSEYDFPPQSAVGMVPPEPMPFPVQPDIPFDITTDIDSYEEGLRNCGIDVSPHVPGTYGTPVGYEAVDYSSYYSLGAASPQEQQS